MVRIRRILCLAVLFAVASLTSAIAQVSPEWDGQELRLHLKTPPTAPPNVQASIVGNPGPRILYYWIVANYTVGNATAFGPVIAQQAPNTLSGSNYVTLSWGRAGGATSYDVLRTNTPSPPSPSCNCAVATAVSSLATNDQSESLNAYTVAALNVRALDLSLANEAVGAAQSHLILRQNGSQVADLSAAAGGTGAGLLNAVLDCGLPTDGITDATALLRACRTSHPGRHFLFPKNRIYGSAACDYQFNTSPLSSAVDTSATSEWWDGGGGSSGMAENEASAVRMCFSSGQTGIEVPRALANGFAITNLHLIGGDCYDWTNAATYVLPFGWGGTNTADGIRAHSRVKIRNVSVECFGRHGISLDTDGYNGNLNTSVVDSVFVTKNRGAGVFIRGVDSNASSFTSISSTFNQLDGIVEESFLGNFHAAHHTDGNGADATTLGSAIPITSSVVTNNFATITAVGHGLVVGDYVTITGSICCSTPANHYFVESVPTADTFIVYQPALDRAVTVETANAFKRSPSAAAGVWHGTLTDCSITNASTILTCNGGGLVPGGAVVGYPVRIAGAGVAGADLLSITTGGPTVFCSVTNWGIAANVLTVTCANTFVVGTVVKLVAFDNDDLRDQEVTVATQAAGNFTANFTHADVAAHANVARVYFSTVTLKNAASTTVSGAAGTIFYRSVPFRHVGNANISLFLNLYSEQNQFPSIFWQTGLIIGGDHGADIDFNLAAPHWIQPSGNGLEIRSPRATIWTAGNQVQDIELQFQPAIGNATLLRFNYYDSTTKALTEGFRVNAGQNFNVQNVAAGSSRFALVANSTGNTDLSPTANSTELRLNFQGAVALTGTGIGFYNGNTTKVGGVDNAGLGTFNGGVKAGASGSTIADTRELLQNVHLCGTTGTCGNTSNGSYREIFGSVALTSASPSTATITGISPAFSSTSSYYCTASPVGTTAAIAASGIAVNNVSSSSFTLTGPNTVTTVINYHCFGN